MHKVLTDFFSAGRSFRHQRLSGDFIIIEKSGTFSEALDRWAQRMGKTAFKFEELEEGWTACRTTKPRCVLVDADCCDEGEAERFLKWVDVFLPEVVDVVYTRYPERAAKLSQISPRLTVIQYGKGVEELFAELDSHIKPSLSA